jgi:hypothetical protein
MKHFPAALRTALCTAFCLLFLAGAPCLADEWNDSFSPPRPYRVLRDIAVRGGPGNQHERLGSVSEGTVLRVHEIVNGWNRFDFQGGQGWIFKRYLRPMAAGEPEQTGRTSPEPPPQEPPPAPLPAPLAPAEPDTAAPAEPDTTLPADPPAPAPAEPDPILPTLPILPADPPAPVPARPDPLTRALEEIAKGEVSEPPASESAPALAPPPVPPPVPAEPLPPAEPSPEQPPDAPEEQEASSLEVEPGLPPQPVLTDAVEPETPPLPPEEPSDEAETPPMEEEEVVPPLPEPATPAGPAASSPSSEEEGEYLAALQPDTESREQRRRPKPVQPAGEMLEHGCERFMSIVPEEKPDAELTAVLQGDLPPGGQACYRLLALADWNVSALLQAPEGISFDIFTPEQGRVAASMRAWAQLMQVSGDKYFVIRAGEASGAFTFELTVR